MDDQGYDLTISYRRRLAALLEDLREVRDQGRNAEVTPTEVSMFKAQLNTFGSTYEQYEQIYNQLADTCDEKGKSVLSESDIASRKVARRYFHEAHASMVNITDKNTAVNNLNNTSCFNNTTVVSGRARAKLPTIPLTVFNGDRKAWPRFRDLFESLVIGDTELTDVDRHHYLVASLREPASAVISNLPISAANFNIAWQTLKNHYDNKRLLAVAYLDQVLNMKPLDRRPSPEVLSTRIAELTEAISAFKLLNIQEASEFIFFHLAVRSLDNNTRISFENANNAEFPNFDNLIDFLRKRSTAAELALSSVPTEKIKPSTSSACKKSNSINKITSTALFTNNQNKSSTSGSPTSSNRSNYNKSSYKPSRSFNKSNDLCFVCKSTSHSILQCEKFNNASGPERHQLLHNWPGCRNCLNNTGHVSRSCPSKWRCRICQKNHHTLLHISTDNNQRNKVTTSPSTTSDAQQQMPLSCHTNAVETVDIMLGTAMCKLSNNEGNFLEARLVLDSGSHFSFITHDCALRLGLNVDNDSPTVWGIGETPLQGFKGRTNCTLTPLHSSTPALTTAVIVVETIASALPCVETSQDRWKLYKNYELADPQFWAPRPVDFLLGCDLFSDIITGQVITVAPQLPKLLGTIFGYSVVGRIQELSEAKHILAFHSRLARSPSNSINQELKRFWEIEEPPVARKIDPLEEKCEEHFLSTHYRLPSGRYGVYLPFKNPEPQFIRSKEAAIKRLYHIESKLERNPPLKTKYHEFMQEYLDLGHMGPANREAKVVIPHHCVVKGDGPEMKIRVVFDAASKTISGSLNDCLMVGPKLQADIVTILLNFRIHTYVFTTDAVKMFRQIEVHPSDRVYQHIVFRFDPAGPVQEYELNTVTYGTTCAPYLAHRVLRQLNFDEGQDFPLATVALAEDVYVDDFVTGAPTLSKALELQSQLTTLMAKGGFSLGKWATNHPDLTAACYKDKIEFSQHIGTPVSFDTEDNPTVKILGIQWDPSSDQFMYKITSPPVTYTKRSVLSSVAKIYDPLGYLGPTVIFAKEIIQASWKLNLDWDQPFPQELTERWNAFIRDLPTLAEVRIPRQIINNDAKSYHLLVFADASERAYCATAYIHFCSPSGNHINLLMAKTKLAPIKVVTIPRLELCAALLAVRLHQSLEPFCKRVNLPFETYYFTDSTVVLAWLSTPSFKLKTFVANRVEAIIEHSNSSDWHHVTSEENPSDLGSRGLPPDLLVNNKLWFHGPSWAQKDKCEWPLKVPQAQSDIPELKLHIPCALASTPAVPHISLWMERISSLSKLLRALAIALRFKDALLAAVNKGPPLATDRLCNKPVRLYELHNSKIVAIKIVQAYEFFNKSHPIEANTPIPKNLESLQPFIDDRGLLLVGGRLRHANLSWSTKHPILLPAKNHFTSLVIQHLHITLLHPGHTVLLANLRNKYWVPGARNIIRQLSRQCVTCRKLGASPCQPVMGDLPSCRFQELRPFLHVGIDFAGPFLVRETSRRKANQYKTYLALFVCLSTKALHLEIVTSLSTEAFMAALERFIGRRGKPNKIVSDNGTNFVGAANHLQDLYKWIRQKSNQDQLIGSATEKDIEWDFIPPASPFFGGVWEAGVKSVKRLLRTIYHDGIMTLEELGTWFIRIEAILNSRPLCPLSSDPNDLNYLSPGDFLIGSPLLAIPEKSLIELPENRLSRWQLVNQKSQHFWNRWRTEYLSNLQERTKWKTPVTNLKIGDLVILKDESAPRLQWPMARVTEVHPGPDEVVRVATVKTAKTTLRRPVNKLIPLFLPNPPPNYPKPDSESPNPDRTPKHPVLPGDMNVSGVIS